MLARCSPDATVEYAGLLVRHLLDRLIDSRGSRPEDHAVPRADGADELGAVICPEAVTGNEWPDDRGHEDRDRAGSRDATRPAVCR